MIILPPYDFTGVLPGYGRIRYSSVLGACRMGLGMFFLLLISTFWGNVLQFTLLGSPCRVDRVGVGLPNFVSLGPLFDKI